MATSSHRSQPLLSSVLLLGFCVWWGDAIRCYVCGPLDDNKFNQTCEDFHLNASHYEQQCPEHFFGCSLHKIGAQSKRECVRMRMNDCKSANNVDYCFCSLSLCNGLNPQLQVQLQDQDTDDEDILDEQGSGEGKAPAQNDNDKNKINVVIQTVGGNSIETIETKSSGVVTSIAIHLLASAVFITCY